MALFLKLTLLITLGFHTAVAVAIPTSVLPKVLFLSTEGVPASHKYFTTALRFVNEHELDHEVLSLNSPIELTQATDGTLTGKYSVIVIGNYADYAQLLPGPKERLDAYCLKFGVGLFFLYVPDRAFLNKGDVLSSDHTEFSSHRLPDTSKALRLLKNGGPLEKPYYGRWLRPRTADHYETLMTSKGPDGSEVATVLLDLGAFDGIKRVFFGLDFEKFWLTHLLFLDSLHWLSAKDLGLSDQRWFGVDLDDIFLMTPPSKGGIKTTESDVQAILEAQKQASQLIGGKFQFHVGYNSDRYEKSGTGAAEEMAGDRLFVEARDQFYWFDHLPCHERSTEFDFNGLKSLMQRSQAWAKDHDVLRFIGSYHVSPYHDGIFPVHEPLFLAWKDVWNAKYTSTVFSPTGFTHNGISVAPRTDLGLPYDVHTWDQVDKYHLEAGARGGFLFRRLLVNPVNIFMTHQANFARDRMASHLLLELLKFTSQWTNLKLTNLASDGLVEQHFHSGNMFYHH